MSACLLASPAAIAAAPGANGRIAFSYSTATSAHIDVINPDGSGRTPLFGDATSNDGSPAWSPDGTRIAFVRLVNGLPQVFVATADGSGATNISNSLTSDLKPSWSPDGRQIAFARSGSIWVMNADGTAQTRLSEGANDLFPSWSPDGSQIAFASVFLETLQEHAMYVDGSGRRLFGTDSSQHEQAPDWAPDGGSLIYARMPFTTGEDCMSVFAAPSSGGPDVELVPRSACATGAIWSPDGEQFAFTDQAGSLYVASAAGGAPRLLVQGGSPAWQPLPDHPLPPAIPRYKLIAPSGLASDGGGAVAETTLWRPSLSARACSYEVQRQTDGGPWVDAVGSSGLELDGNVAIGLTYDFRVRSVACDGTASQWAVGVPFAVDGYQEGRFAYEGVWSRAKSGGAWGGATRSTTQAGASATLTFVGRNFAWVSPRGPRRGSAEVYVDGVLRKTVSTYSATNRPRRVLFKWGWPASGRHSVRIVNAATTGHPRVDLDGLVALR